MIARTRGALLALAVTALLPAACARRGEPRGVARRADSAPPAPPSLSDSVPAAQSLVYRAPGAMRDTAAPGALPQSASAPYGLDTVLTVQLVAVGGHDTVPVLMVDSTIGAASLATEAHLLGSVGPLVFVIDRVFSYTCGAHGNVGAEFVVLELGRGAVRDVLAPPERAAYLRALRADVAERFRRVPDGNGPFRPDSMTLTALWPTFGATTLGVALQFTSDACFACSDDVWSSYSRSLVAPAPDLPARLRPWADVPVAAQAWFGANAPDSGAGWSRRGDTLLVWHRTMHAPETAWILPDGDGFREVARRPGVYIAAAGRLWRWAESSVSVAKGSCEVQ